MHGREIRPGCSPIFGYGTGVAKEITWEFGGHATLPFLASYVSRGSLRSTFRGNDLDVGSALDPVLVALDIQRLAVKLLGLGVKQVAVCQVIRRRKWRNFSYEEGAARVIKISDYLEHFCNDTKGVFFVEA